MTLTGGLPVGADLPADRTPGQALWVENFWWLAFDQAAGAGVMVHLASTPHDFGLLRQTVIAFLPDGTLLADLSVGGGRGAEWVSGPTARADCQAPFERWAVRMNGTGERTTIEELWAGPLRHGPRLPLRLDLECTCLSAAWDAAGGEDDGMREQDWASAHYQQTIRLAGTIVADDQEIAVDCVGVRDHSRGARNLTSWGGHCVLTAPFGSGRAFGLMMVLGADGEPVLNAAYVARDGEVERGRVVDPPPRLGPALLESEAFDVAIEIGDMVHRIGVQTPAAGGLRSLLTMLPPNDIVLGIDRRQDLPIALGWVPATYTWDGERASGIVERSLVAHTLPERHGPAR